MDYVVGNIAALISGNVTPNRPRLTKRASTPTKHMPSPNVTPKSEFVDDRSVFLSPSVQKKKAIVKKSPKRIFQNPDLDVTNENEGSTSISSPKADKVKKHLKGDLEAIVSPKNITKVANISDDKDHRSVESPSPKKKNKNINLSSAADVSVNELTPKKKKKQRKSITENSKIVIESIEPSMPQEGTPKKGKKQKKVANTDDVQNDVQAASTNDASDSVKTLKKKKKKRNNSHTIESEVMDKLVDDISSEQNQSESASPKKKNKKRKKSITETTEENEAESNPTKKKKVKVNPNAVTDKDSDSEHESDDEINSETEEINKEVLENTAEAEEQSSDEEETPAPNKKKKETEQTEKVKEVNTEEEIKRTLFVGNVPFSKKCKKEIKKIFSKYGQIESVRIRAVPVKDPSVTPKLAVIKQELHPERSTVNVYVKFTDPQCVDQALAENNTVLNNNHLRVSRSGSTGAEHDPRRSVFVGNVPFALEDEALRECFQRCGDVESVRIVRDRKTGAGKGFAYVNFASRDSVELALALTDEDLTIKNRIMRVKRCTQVTQRAQRGSNAPSRGGFQGRNISQGDRQRNQGSNKPFNQTSNFNQGRFQGNRGGHAGNRGGYSGNRGGHSGNRGGYLGNRGGHSGNRGGYSGNRGGHSGNRGGFAGNRGGRFQSRGGHSQVNRGGHDFQGDRNNFRRENDGEKQDGAYRRLMNKRKSEEGGEGGPGKVSEGAPREKKARKEFVGVTAEKRKKHKFDKGQKKKKALSEILTK